MTINIEGELYPIQLSFATLPFGYFIKALDEKDPLQRLSSVSNIPLDKLSKLSFESLSQLFESYGYIDHLELLGEGVEPYDIGNDSWGKFERAKLAVDTKQNGLRVALSIATVYTNKDYIGIPTLEAYKEVKSYLDGFAAFNERYKRLNDWKPTNEQMLAGIDRFKDFGIMPQFFQIRKSYPNLSDDEVWELKAETIYYKFLIDFEQSMFDKAYSEVISKKK